MASVAPHSASAQELWLPTGEAALRRMLEAIEHAWRTVRLETYIFRATGPGEDFRAALTRAASRGVRAQVLLDGFGSAELPRDFWDEFQRAGGVVRIFNPLSLQLFALRNHRKLLVVDDAVAFVGGFNIGPEYDGDGLTRGWRDLGLELHRPAAIAPLVAAFDGMFENPLIHRRMLRGLQQPTFHRHHRFDGRRIALLSGPRLLRNEFRVALMHDLKHAKHVQLISAYFVPSIRLRWSLNRVVRRGGKVDLILAGKTDVPLAQAAGRSLYGPLLRVGVRIWEYQPQILHTKLAIVDDIVFAGSSNLDTRSFGINYEVMVRLADRRLAAEARELFAADQNHSTEITLAEWRGHQGWRERLRGFWARTLLTKIDPWVARRQLRALS